MRVKYKNDRGMSFLIPHSEYLGKGSAKITLKYYIMSQYTVFGFLVQSWNGERLRNFALPYRDSEAKSRNVPFINLSSLEFCI